MNRYSYLPSENGFAAPWRVVGRSVSNAKLNLRNPIRPDGNPSNATRLMLAVAKYNGSPKSVIAPAVGLEAKPIMKYVSGTGYVDTGNKYYSWNSYFEALRICGIIKYDRKVNGWFCGPNWEVYFKEVLVPAMEASDVGLITLTERCNIA